MSLGLVRQLEPGFVARLSSVNSSSKSISLVRFCAHSDDTPLSLSLSSIRTRFSRFMPHGKVLKLDSATEVAIRLVVYEL